MCPLSDVDVMVVDDQISDEWRNRVTDAGVRLVIARQTDSESETSETNNRPHEETNS
jgi:hypothetical protein